MKTNKNAKEDLAQEETVLNPSIYHTLQFERDVEDWNLISQGLNLLICHSIKSRAANAYMNDEHAKNCIEAAHLLKIEIEQAVSYSLTNIGGTNQLFKNEVTDLDVKSLIEETKLLKERIEYLDTSINRIVIKLEPHMVTILEKLFPEVYNKKNDEQLDHFKKTNCVL